MRKPVETEERVCGFCKTTFVVRGYHARSDRKKYCSKTCKHRGLSVHERAKQMTPEQAAWLAGLFDGEGWVSWVDPTCLTTFRIGIASTHRPLLERVHEVTGTGRIRDRPKQNEKHSMSWVWYAFSHNASILLTQMLPWLIVKREFAEIALGLRHVEMAPMTTRGMAQSATKKRIHAEHRDRVAKGNGVDTLQ